MKISEKPKNLTLYELIKITCKSFISFVVWKSFWKSSFFIDRESNFFWNSFLFIFSDSIVGDDENNDFGRVFGNNHNDNTTIYLDDKTAFKQQLQQRLSNGNDGIKTPMTGKKKPEKQRPTPKLSDDAMTVSLLYRLIIPIVG